MKGFGRWTKTDGLERRLRDERPGPPQELLDEIVTRIEGSHRPSLARASFRRLALAGVSAAAMLVVFAAFGGVGFAASGVSGAASSTAKAVSKLVKPNKASSSTSSRTSSTNSRRDDNGNGNNGNGNGDDNGNNGDDDECEDDDDDGAAEDEYCDDRRTICHVNSNGKRTTLTLPARAAARHLNNHPRDRRGPCRNNNGDGGDD